MTLIQPRANDFLGTHIILCHMTYFLTQTPFLSPLLCYGQKYILVEKELRYFLQYKSPLHDFLWLAQQGPKVRRQSSISRQSRWRLWIFLEVEWGKNTSWEGGPLPLLSPHVFDPISNLQEEKNWGYGHGHGLLILHLFSYISKPSARLELGATIRWWLGF